MVRSFVLILFFVLGLNNLAHAQNGGGSPGHNPQLGVFIGRVLPHSISSTDDIFTLWGVRYSSPMGKGDKSGGSFLDYTFFGGNGANVHWGGLSLDLSMQIPIETLVAAAGLGFDYTQYSSDIQKQRGVFGEHFIGSVMSRIGDTSLLRFDMKFNANPGSTVFFGIGLVVEFDGSSSNSGGT